jgi:hypothetical protein
VLNAGTEFDDGDIGRLIFLAATFHPFRGITADAAKNKARHGYHQILDHGASP